ncbi:DUF5009 domain-containing protein [Rubrolithibacter danxiaensis]|uniref:DUF5009 domain-containing protein n=1 Tax=Rubrolithibacter danxiaensis TaxID=3390805 RepID=UPI003BF7B4B7
MKQLPRRLLSIDVFRALTMLLMIFVNDVDGVKNIPGWIKHVQADADGLGFADTIFPAFLFIVGLSLPFAIKNRMGKGHSFYALATYILTRSFALIVMGFFHVNLENYNSNAILPRAVWEVLITVSFFLIWLDYPESLSKVKRNVLTGTGIFLLIIMAFLFKGGEPTAPVGLKPYWWGILGIIGWTYLVCGSIFLLSKGRFSVLVVVLVLFLLINIAAHTGLLPFSIWIIGDASSASLTMAGVVISLVYSRMAGKGKDAFFWILLLGLGIGMIAFGNLIRPYAEGISKIHSTPAWVTICIGISILVFEFMIWLVDVKEKQNWFKNIRPAGTSTLTCYLIPYFLYSIFTLTHFWFPDFLIHGTGGIIRSFAVAFFVIWLAGILEKRRIRLKV